MKKFEEEIKGKVETMATQPGCSMTRKVWYKADDIHELSNGWVSLEDHQAEIGKIELQNLKYREEIARMQKSLRKKNKAIKELNGAVKKNKARLKECEDLRIEANNKAAMEYSRKCEVVEERAELKRENQRLRAENLAVKTLVEDAKKQQPEIPEVPHLVADWLDKKPLYAINGSIPVEIIGWSQKQTGYADLGMNISHLLKLKVNGYTVAKEKRFYLKNKLTTSYLELDKTNDYFHHIMNPAPYSDMTRKSQFTQQEIDSMAAESYEQIEVGDD